MGIPHHPPRFDTDLLRPFYEGLEREELLLTACSECGAWCWYPQEVPPCHPTGSLTWRKASSRGTIYTFTTVVRDLLPGADQSEAPYTVLLVEPDDAPGARVPALFLQDGGQEPECGMAVRLSPVRSGASILAAFRPL